MRYEVIDEYGRIHLRSDSLQWAAHVAEAARWAFKCDFHVTDTWANGAVIAYKYSHNVRWAHAADKLVTGFKLEQRQCA